MEVLPEYLDSGKMLIDLSGDYRLKDPSVYEEFYGATHKDTANLDKFVYGLSEVYEEQIKGALFIANPGCFPTGVQLALYPLLKNQWIKSTQIIVDAKTGVSGGGKNPQQGFHYAECNESFKAYKMGVHQHEPEMEQGLRDALNKQVNLLFVAHLAPMTRGIFSTIYCQMNEGATLDNVKQALQTTYADKPFVRILEPGVSPEIKHVEHTNYCDIGYVQVGQTLILMTAIDNLVKGAAGQAIQNMNIALGLSETEGLL
jgi:N-acetyl-gamma-glutamyl-phosphate reductase